MFLIRIWYDLKSNYQHIHVFMLSIRCEFEKLIETLKKKTEKKDSKAAFISQDENLDN